MSDVEGGGTVAPLVALDSDLPEPQNGATPVSDQPTPAELEATGAETVSVEFEGQTYVMPAVPDELDGDTFDAIEAYNLSAALKGLLGPDQWSAFKATKPKVKHYKGLLNTWGEAVGVNAQGG